KQGGSVFRVCLPIGIDVKFPIWKPSRVHRHSLDTLAPPIKLSNSAVVLCIHLHIDLRVRDLEAVRPFYSKVLPELGFRKEWRGEGAFSFLAEGKLPKQSWFG